MMMFLGFLDILAMLTTVGNITKGQFMGMSRVWVCASRPSSLKEQPMSRLN